MSITSDWKQKMRDANADLRASTEVPANDFKSRATAFRDKRAAGRKDEEPTTDVEFFEGPEGYIHPIRGTKGYSNKKAGK